MAVTVELDAEGPAAVLRVSGILDERGAQQVYSRAEEVIGSGFRFLVLNLSGVSQITPDGVMLIESIRHDFALSDGRILLTMPQRQAAETLGIYGIHKHLVVSRTEREALLRIDNTLIRGWTEP